MRSRFWEFGAEVEPDEIVEAVEILLEEHSTGSDFLVIPASSLNALTGEKSAYLKSRFSDVFPLRVPVTGVYHKSFFVFLLAKVLGLSEEYTHHLYDEGDFQSVMNCNAGKLGHAVNSLEESAKIWGDYGDIVSFQLEDLCDLVEELSEGDVGVILKRNIRKINQEYSFFRDTLYGDNVFSSGELRSAGTAKSLLLKWRGLIGRRVNTCYLVSPEFDEVLSHIEKLLSRLNGDKTQINAANYESGFWSKLFIVTSAWYLRLALIQKERKDFYREFILCLVRSFELALQASALYCKRAELVPSDGSIIFDGKKIEGCGLYISKVEDRKIRTNLKTGEDIGDFVVEARKFLSLRNHSSLAHGLLDIDRENFNDVFSGTKAMISRVLEPELLDEFNFFFNNFKLPKLNEALMKAFKDSLTTLL